MSKMKLYGEKSDVVYLTQNKDPFFAYLTRKVFEEVDWSKKNGRLLDLGCGSGRLALAAVRNGFEVVGVDYVAKAINIANDEAKRLGLTDRVRFMQGDLTAVESGQFGKFDYVVLMEVIEHIDDYQKVIDFAWGSLKPGGKLLLTTPNDPAYWTILDDYARHIRRFTIPQVKIALKKFSKVKIGTFGYPLHRLAELIYNLLMQSRNLKHKPKLFRLNPFVSALYYAIGSFVMAIDDLFAWRDGGTTIIAIAAK